MRDYGRHGVWLKSFSKVVWAVLQSIVDVLFF